MHSDIQIYKCAIHNGDLIKTVHFRGVKFSPGCKY